MTVTLDLPPDVEIYVVKEAERQKTSVSDYITRRVSETASIEKAERERKVALLDQLLELGDEDEQRETFEFLKQAIDEDRLSNKKRFK